MSCLMPLTPAILHMEACTCVCLLSRVVGHTPTPCCGALGKRCRCQPRKAGTDVAECEAMGKLQSMEV